MKMLNVIKLMRYHLKRRQLLFQNKCINLLCISELTMYGNYRQRFPFNISHTNSVCDYSAVWAFYSVTLNCFHDVLQMFIDVVY